MEDEGDESKFIQRAAQGDGDAFAELFRRYYQMIHAFAYRICLHPVDAEEIAQETFVKAARSLASLQTQASFKNWLYRIAQHTALDFGRAKGRRSRLVDAAAVQEAVAAEGHPADHSSVAEALQALPEDWRSAIVLIFYEGMNHAEAARVLGCAEATVSWRIFMAKRKLKKLLSNPTHE